MLDIKFIRENPEKVKEGLRKKQADDIDIDRLLRNDAEYRKLLMRVETVRGEMNALSDAIAAAKQAKDEEVVRRLLQEAERKKCPDKDVPYQLEIAGSHYCVI